MSGKPCPRLTTEGSAANFVNSTLKKKQIIILLLHAKIAGRHQILVLCKTSIKRNMAHENWPRTIARPCGDSDIPIFPLLLESGSRWLRAEFYQQHLQERTLTSRTRLIGREGRTRRCVNPELQGRPRIVFWEDLSQHYHGLYQPPKRQVMRTSSRQTH